MRSLIILAAIALLTACKHQARPDLPGLSMAVAPTVVTVERVVYVAIPAHLTRPEPIAEGPIDQCFNVAAKRRGALQRANAKLTQISTIQGTEVQP